MLQYVTKQQGIVHTSGSRSWFADGLMLAPWLLIGWCVQSSCAGRCSCFQLATSESREEVRRPQRSTLFRAFVLRTTKPGRRRCACSLCMGMKKCVCKCLRAHFGEEEKRSKHGQCLPTFAATPSVWRTLYLPRQRNDTIAVEEKAMHPKLCKKTQSGLVVSKFELV